MAYERQTWETGTIIPESKLLHIENGIYDVTETADQNTEDIATNKTDIEKNASDIATNKDDADSKYDELNSALAESNVMDYTGEEIPSGANLNDYSTPGKYYVRSATYAAAITNSPFTNAGYTLIVIRTQTSTRRMQIVLGTTSANVLYTRSYTDSVWTDWERLAKYSEIPSSSETVNIYRVNLGSSNDYIAANFCFSIANMGNWPALIYFQNRIGVIAVTGTSVDSSLSTSPISVTWLNGSAPAALNTIQAALHDGATNGVRIKISASSANSNADIGIIPMRNNTCYNYYASTS